MRRLAAALLTLGLFVALPAASQVTPEAAGAAGGVCPLVVVPLHNPSVRVSLPLRVSLEWDTRGTNQCAQWRAAMQRASAFLENATGGQAALGPVTIEDNAQDWTAADIQVRVQNTSVPDATIGGIDPAVVDAVGGSPGYDAISPTATVSSGGAFARGAIHLGRSWSEFGPRRGRWSDPDGYKTIVHELGHYAFYLYDEYFGYSAAGRVPASCTAQLFNPASDIENPLPDQAGGSIMYWEYSLQQFWGTGAAASPSCLQSRQWQVYGQPDWKVIAAHYPIVQPAAPVAPAPASPPCVGCNAPALVHWLFDFAPYVQRQNKACASFDGSRRNESSTPCLLADGFLVKSGGSAVLHEGVPYLPVPAATHTIPGAPGFYPALMLEMLGVGRGDVARITLTDPANPNEVKQVALRLTGPTGFTSPTPKVPAWYAAGLPAVPMLSVQPLVTSGSSGPTVSALQVTASNPLSVPFLVAGQRGGIEALLFESGQGRQASGTLHLSSSPAAGHETYTGTISLDPTNPIMEGSFYVTPSVGEQGHEDPDTVSGGAWAMANYSISCNSPTYYLVGRAPGDEGGIDSADGVVSVHLPSNSDAPGLCVGVTAQSTTPVPGSINLGQSYAVVGSSPLPPGTVISIHFDTDALPSGPQGTLTVVKGPVPSRGGRNAGTCAVAQGLSVDLADGTVSFAVSAGGDAGYQLAYLTPAGAKRIPTCSGPALTNIQ